MDNLYSRTFPALYRGIIEDNVDPEKLGRCKVRVPSVHGELSYPIDILPWARPLVFNPIGTGKGSINIPEVGDIVWVLFEGSKKEFPVYFGGTYGEGDLEIDNDTVVIYTENDSQISYDRRENSYTLVVGENKIVLSEKDLRLIGDTKVEGSLEVEGYVGSTNTIQPIPNSDLDKICKC